jgi:hypothetical protein
MTDSEVRNDSKQNNSSSESSKQDGSKKIGLVMRALWWCAGADREVLEQCPAADHIRYEGMGAIVLSTTLIAFLSGSYAFRTVFLEEGSSYQVPKAVLFGIVWAAIIFNVDRFIVSTSSDQHGASGLRKLVSALPRIALGFVIGICLSKPLEIRVFQSEIEGYIELRRAEVARRRTQELRQLLIADRDARLRDKMREIEDARADVRRREEQRSVVQQALDRQNEVVSRETMGDVGSSGRAGFGPRASMLSQERDRLRDDLARIDREIRTAHEHVSTFERQVAELRALYEGRMRDAEREAKREAQQQVRAGLLLRIQIGDEVSGLKGTFLSLLLLAIELGPIFFKLMLNRSAYDYLCENKKLIVLAREGISLNVLESALPGGVVHEDVRFLDAKSKLNTAKDRIETEQELRRSAIEQEAEKIRAHYKLGNQRIRGNST